MYSRVMEDADVERSTFMTHEMSDFQARRASYISLPSEEQSGRDMQSSQLLVRRQWDMHDTQTFGTLGA